MASDTCVLRWGFRGE